MTFGQRVARSREATERLANWNLHLQPTPVQIEGRLLPPVEITFGNNKTVTPNAQSADWSRDIQTAHVLDQAGGLVNWALIFPSRDGGQAKEFADTLGRVARGMGINVAPPIPIPLENPRNDAYKQGCIQAQRSVQNCKLIIALLARKDRAPYELIKKTTLVDMGIPSQVVVLGTLRKGMMSVCTKIMQQLCVKLGGAIWKVKIPMKMTMICGFDTYHDSAARGRSVGGFVATIDADFTKYYSRSFQHEVRAEISHDLVVCITEAIKVFSDRNGQLPTNILFYRDGVADNQLKAVHEVEVQQLLTGFKAFGTDWMPKMAVVVVQKRIRPRFFLTGRGQNLENPLPGTIVDNTVTNPRSYDFYVIAQSVRQGTVTPTRYNIIFETTPLRPDHHHQMAYRLSHLYYNWPGTIRVVAPCHYSHKLAYLIGQHVHTEAHHALRHSLYYL